MLTFARTRAGHYQATHTDGAVVEVEYVDFRGEGGYEDHGWVWWVDGERSDYPVATKWYAIELVEDYLANWHDTNKAAAARAWAAQVGR
jgi:hypothetical protein